MHGTTTSVRPAGRLSQSQVGAELDPAWRPWVRLLDLALAAADDPVWMDAVPEPSPARPSAAPLIHETVVRVDARRVRKLVRELLREVSSFRAGACPEERQRREGGILGVPVEGPVGRDTGTRPRLDALGVLRGAIAQDAGALERLAARAGVAADPLATVAQLAAIPLLRACATHFHGRVSDAWDHGYCPVCGAWPTLVEIRGLERSRRLRCGRCSSDWPIHVLRCPFCNEGNHDKLHALLPEGSEQTRRVDVCDTCKGYIKGISTLQPAGLRALALTDLSTIELDLVAQERGYERPADVGFAMSLTVVRATGPRNVPRNASGDTPPVS
jgi:FdhE protein